MTERSIKIPGPDHPITIEPSTARVRIRVGERLLADTRDALTLREARYPAVHYIPRRDVDMSLLTASGHRTYCPYKGDCSYYSLPGDDARGVDAVWSYEAPFEAVAAIAGHLAFYPDRGVSIDLG